MISKAKVKYIQGLCQKKFRSESDHYLVEGPRMMHELLQWCPESMAEVFATQEWVEALSPEDVAVIEKRITIVTDIELASVSCQETPNKVLALVQKKPENLPSPVSGIVLLLDAIRDPGNLGTIIRTADWFGVKSIICSEDAADCYNPKVVQASMGGIFRMNISYANLPAWIEGNASLPLICASLDGEDLYGCKSYTDAMIVIGNEARGISNEVMGMCTKKITIPRMGHAESLNAAVATGIILAHFCKG